MEDGAPPSVLRGSTLANLQAVVQNDNARDGVDKGIHILLNLLHNSVVVGSHRRVAVVVTSAREDARSEPVRALRWDTCVSVVVVLDGHGDMEHVGPSTSSRWCRLRHGEVAEVQHDESALVVSDEGVDVALNLRSNRRVAIRDSDVTVLLVASSGEHLVAELRNSSSGQTLLWNSLGLRHWNGFTHAIIRHTEDPDDFDTVAVAAVVSLGDGSVGHFQDNLGLPRWVPGHVDVVRCTNRRRAQLECAWHGTGGIWSTCLMQVECAVNVADRTSSPLCSLRRDADLDVPWAMDTIKRHVKCCRLHWTCALGDKFVQTRVELRNHFDVRHQMLNQEKSKSKKEVHETDSMTSDFTQQETGGRN